MSNLESTLDDLEHALKASGGDDGDNEKQKEHSGKTASATRLAMVKQAAMDMSPEERKEARKAFDDDDNKKKDARRASDHDYDDDKKKDARRASDHDYDDDKKKDARRASDDDDDKKKDARRIASDHEDDKDRKIASLTASLNFHISKPVIDKMLSARVRSGMPQPELDAFKKSLYGKTVSEIQQRFDEDRHLFASNNRLLSAPNDSSSHYSYDGNDDVRPVPFIDGSGGADLSRPLDASVGGSDMTLEEMFK